jgi:hypothetical protein
VEDFAATDYQNPADSAPLTEHASKTMYLDSIQGISFPYIWANCFRPGSDIGLRRARSPSKSLLSHSRTTYYIDI